MGTSVPQHALSTQGRLILEKGQNEDGSAFHLSDCV